MKKDFRFLVCAPSNSAADLLLSRLSQNLTPMDIFRLNALSRSQPLDKSLEKFCFVSKSTANRFDIPDLKLLLKYRIIVTTCCTAAVLSGVGVPGGHFTHVFIDEGGQALEPEAMIPLNTFDHPPSTRIIIAGDHKQLGPIIHSTVARKLGLGISLLERLMSYCQWDRPSYSYRVFKMHNPRRGKSDMEKYSAGAQLYSVKLLNNYRSHEGILEVPNDLFYKSELQVCAEPLVSNYFTGWSLLPNKTIPVMFMHTVGKDMREGDSPSWFNITEVQLVSEVITRVKESYPRITNDQFGVITPYNKQAQSIRTILKSKHEGISVGTVENFQGQERMVIIISTVRSNPEYLEHDTRYNLGFLNDPKRFNVAMTRAKALLIVIGNGNILCQDPSWRRWIEYCVEKKCISGLDSELKENLSKELPEQLEDIESDDEGLQQEEAGWREME
jgi:helicase MOV-10